MSSQKPITKNHVTVHTATIDVKVLRLDKKQMTLSVFRQLPEKQIISCDFAGCPPFNITLAGVPWGKVLYKWESCQEWVDYWVVWEADGYLYRSPTILWENESRQFKYGDRQEVCCKCPEAERDGNPTANDKWMGHNMLCKVCRTKPSYRNVPRYKTNGWGMCATIDDHNHELLDKDNLGIGDDYVEKMFSVLEALQRLDQLFIAV